jgi:putative transport protein
LLDFPLVTQDIIITHKNAAGKTLQQLGSEYGQGIMLNKLVRSSQELPFEPGTIIHRGDILNISGRAADVERAVSQVGYHEANSFETDLIFVGVGILIGALVGLLTVKIGGIAITLSTRGGALVMGLVFGWFHSKRPSVGHIPEPALWIFDTLGLAAFLGIVGIAAGPTFIPGLKHTGISIVFTGLVVAILPHIIGLFFGRYVLKMKPLILLGAQSGAGTTTTALKAIQEEANSKIPVLGYTIPYALGNILLTAWGPVIVSLMTM